MRGLRAELGRRCREIAERDFSVVQVAERTEAVYRRGMGECVGTAQGVGGD